MIILINILTILMPLIYISVAAVYTRDFYSETVDLTRTKRTLLLVTVITHFIYLLLWTFEYKHAPIVNKFELFTSIAFTITLAYFIVELYTKVRITGYLILSFALIFQILSSIFIQGEYDVPEVLRNPLLGIHVISALLGHSSLIISAVYGFLFIILYNRIKAKNFGTYFNKLPSLESLEQMSFTSLLIGYCILTFSIIIGGIWLPFAFPKFAHLDPKLISTIFIWLVYTFGITAKKIFKWYGKKVIYLSIIGFIVVIISMMVPFIFKSSFHNFR